MQCNESEFVFFFSSRRRHTRLQGDWSSDVCSSDLSYPFGIISIMNRISMSLSGSGLPAGLPPGLDRLNRAPTYTSNDRQQDRQVRYLFWKHLLRVGLHKALSGLPARLASQEANQRPDGCANL